MNIVYKMKMSRKIEICQLCAKELNEDQYADLEILSYIQFSPDEWCLSSNIYMSDDKILEEAGFIVTHEIDSGIYFKVKMRKKSLIEVTTFKNGNKIEETISSLFVCRDFKYHSFLLSK